MLSFLFLLLCEPGNHGKRTGRFAQAARFVQNKNPGVVAYRSSGFDGRGAKTEP
jgi:hypothetical protein